MKTYLILSCATGYGGAEKSLELLAAELAKNGRVIVFAENDRHIKALNQIQGNISVVRLHTGKSPVTIISTLRTVLKYYHKYKDAYFLSNTNKGAFYMALLKAFVSLPQKRMIIYIRDYQWKYRKFIFNKLNHANYAIPTASLLEKENFLKKYISADQVSVTGNPVKLPDDPKINGTNDYFLLLANISRWKGIIYLLKAYDESHLYKKNIRVVISGKIADESYYKELQNFLKEKKLIPYVTVQPFQQDTSTLYENALAVVNTSISEFGGPETFGRTIIEAWSYKKPVVSFDCGGPKYLIDNNKNGFLVREKDVDDLKNALEKLAENESLRINMGMAGYSAIFEKYTPDKIVRKLNDIWESAEP